MGLLERMDKQRTTTKTDIKSHLHDELKETRELVHRQAIDLINRRLTGEQKSSDSSEIFSMIEGITESTGNQIARPEKNRIVREVFDEICGLGPLESLLADPTVSEIMVIGPGQVFVEQEGRLHLTDVVFRNDEHVLNVIDRIVSPLGRHIDEASPMVDARLPDGSRVNAVIPPLSLKGPVITIRKFSGTPLQIQDLIRFGSLSVAMASFLEACVKGRLNIVVSGGTGSGKTTLLNVLSTFIPSHDRIITIEDAAELQLRQPHVVVLESRPSNLEGKGSITIRDLVRNALRMRPDRIVVGEVRGGEALDMLQAMNTGHDGSLTTAHANSPRDLLSRMETMVLMAGMDLPVKAIREQVSSAVDLVVQQSRLPDGSRRITSISEVLGMEGDIITLQEVFSFETEGKTDTAGRFKGYFRAAGIRPRCLGKIKSNGIAVSEEWFSHTRDDFRQGGAM
jgi:pilus assembly protein CpaF